MLNSYRIIESNLSGDVLVVWDNENKNKFSIHKLGNKGDFLGGVYFDDFMSANLYYNQFREKYGNIDEYCSSCGANANLSYDFKIQRCSECGELVYPCTLCEQEYVNCFNECPLNKVKKYELKTYNDKLEVLESEIEEHFEVDIETFLSEYTYDDVENLADILGVKIKRQDEYSI
ncbi:MAG: hypothetical protein IJ086_03680 [Clostridium sp.]|nr:hypothetical protein [Clostridium sp.]